MFKNQANCLLIALVFGALYYFSKAEWLLYAGGFFAISAITAFTARNVFTFWMFIGKVLGKINAVIILSVVFFLVLIPLSAIRRITARRKGSDLQSTFIARNMVFSAKDLANPW